ncbi:uncharacterized protein LOC104908046 [Beta vulgaris subsp. vulgaris]|uniref:uncharacterized protein LOC104908046 n=1 Tax=Beta vulgaris subsp. vulgaris TaxID=3555 RepID=UPI00053FD8CA|nr:uncharacterized protein LOC104908046 [Beta vulgaris subsp. vulgaris]
MSKRPRNTLLNYFKSNNSTEEETNQDVEIESEDGNDASRLPQISKQPSKYKRVDLSNLLADPGLRNKITDYHINDQIEIRKYYVLQEPFQPRKHDFPQRIIGGSKRRFNPDWYDTYGDWLEYSIVKDAAYCRYCYLFKSDDSQKGGGDAFVTVGWSSWNKRERLDIHVGECGSSHNQAYTMFETLKNEVKTVKDMFNVFSDKEKEDYRNRLEATVECIKWLLRMGLAFRGHNESTDSKNRGNFVELLKFLANNNEDIDKVVLENAPKNLQLVSPEIQKDIVHACSRLTVKAIMEDLGDDIFGILVDESRDVSIKEQMAIVLRYVDHKGIVTERFLGIIHVPDTTALTLKAAIDLILSENGLTVSRIRRQGYDGASNMQGEFNGLKTLVLKENKSAFSIPCFAHQLQLTLVAVASKQGDIASFFSLVS